MSADIQARIEVIQKTQAAQQKSSCSESRKDRLLTALFQDADKFLATVNLYHGLLRIFEHFVKTFQAEKPLMHALHFEMYDMVRKFLVLFMKREHVPEFSIKALKNLKSSIQDRALQVSDRRLIVGEFAYNHFQ